MKKIKIILGVFVLLAMAYSGGWLYMAKKINRAIDQFYLVDAPNQGIIFLDERPALTGFPLRPTIEYKGGFETNKYLFEFKKIEITGFPIPNFPVKIEVFGLEARNEDGELLATEIILHNKNTRKFIILDHAATTFSVPQFAPQSLFRADIEKWKDEVGEIAIKDFMLERFSVKVHGNGTIGLDDNLQIDMNIKTKTRGYEDIIHFFVSHDIMNPLMGSVAMSGFNAIAQTDDESNEKFIELDFTVKNQEISLGSIKLHTLPLIQWPG